MNAPSNTATHQLLAVDRLVLAAVNAPFRREITADVLAGCLVKTELHEWAAHLANFFSDVSPDLVIAFAEFHGIAASRLTQAYSETRKMTGESHPELEAALAPLAPAA